MKPAVLGATMLVLLSGPARAQEADFAGLLNRINLPEGFEIAIFAQVPRARSLALDPSGGVVFVGSRHGHVHSVVDTDRDGAADAVHERASGLNVPNGVAIQGAFLYVGMQDRIARWPLPADVGTATPLGPPATLHDGIDEGAAHGWRYIGFGPDRKLYVSLGAPCNICDLRSNTGKIIRMDPDGSNVETVADGVRNSVGFDWHPVTGELWFTDNGADGMGDDTPPDELNRVTRIGAHFGFPYVGGKATRLAGYENREPPTEPTPAEIEFQAHSANLGIEFYDGDMFPAEYRNDAFVAQHGSWNRTEPVGYRIVRVRFDDAGNAVGREVFADGWLSADGDVAGRPVDIEELPDGSLLVSDDFAGVIYRISHGG